MHHQCFLFVAMILAIHVKEGRLDKKPHVVIIMADDLGYNDVGYHKMNGIETPCIDQLATGGTVLENYYVQPLCSPSRSQLLSGRYQIHTGLQHSIVHPNQPFGLPLDNILLPEQLKGCGYRTHMVGKWHLGHFKKEYLPWERGFEDYTGILTGNADYYTHIMGFHEMRGKSMHTSQDGPTAKYDGVYSTELYTEIATNIIQNHDKINPLFLYLAHQAVHKPLQSPKHYDKSYKHIKDQDRRMYAQMVSYLDSCMCKVVDMLQHRKMWKDTILIFTSDNGGQIKAGGNNWPLRGSKGTLWEGGIKSVGFVNGGFKIRNNHTARQLFHISDWMPTLMNAANCSIKNGTLPLDGVSQWDALTRGEASPREEILHNIDPLRVAKRKNYISGNRGFDTRVRAAIRHGPWKLLTGNQKDGNWIAPPEIESTSIFPPTSQKLLQLYNIEVDPLEQHEISSDRPDIVDLLLTRLAFYNETAVPVWYPDPDEMSNPNRHEGFWGPWL